MKRIIPFFVLSFLAVQLCWAQIPRTISYQGILKDADGKSVSDDTYTISFKLYSVATGGTALWTEEQSVSTTEGIFNAILGSNNPLYVPFDKQYWLSVTVDDGSELTPRLQLTSSAYSLNAQSVADGKVVKSINNLKDNVTLAGGDNISITESGSILTISADIEKGDKGDTGPQGSQGLKGDKGYKGDTGLQGQKGLNGNKGDKGDTGLKGSQGLNGDKGNKGDTGLQGQKGLNGDKGYKGDTGLQGPQGLKGDKGNKGDTGFQGSQGLNGDKGYKGDTGFNGPQGLKGNKGDTGATGSQGPQGPEGPPQDSVDELSGGDIRGDTYVHGTLLAVRIKAGSPSSSNYDGYVTAQYDVVADRDINAGDDLYAGDDISCGGTKYAVIQTVNYGKRLTAAEECMEVYLFDRGQASLSNGEVTIELEPIFLETVTINTEHPMIVQITLTADCNGVFVSEKNSTNFKVKELMNGTSNATFDWEVAAKRIGYEDDRLEEFQSED